MKISYSSWEFPKFSHIVQALLGFGAKHLAYLNFRGSPCSCSSLVQMLLSQRAWAYLTSIPLNQNQNLRHNSPGTIFCPSISRSQQFSNNDGDGKNGVMTTQT